jgi:hypothetical protein
MRCLGLVGVLIVMAFAGAGATSAESVAVTCAAWAAPGGSDTNIGSRQQPFATIGHLVQVLSPGKTGCLVGGATYPEHVVVGAQGTPAAPIRITTGEGAPATIGDGLEFGQGARNVVVDRVAVVITGLEPTNSLHAVVILRGFRNALVRSDVSAGPGKGESRSCILLDHARKGLVDRNRIHDCAAVTANRSVVAQGVLVSISVASRITSNTIVSLPGSGVALAPKAQYTVVSRNLIDSADVGVFIGGNARTTSNDNRVEHNIVSFPLRFAVDGSNAAGGPPGKRNLVTRNCFWKAGQANLGGTGYLAPSNRTVDPRFVDHGTGLALKPTSPCWSYRPQP